MGTDEDIEIGEKILMAITPFIINLHNQGLARKTIIKYMDNLWILGAQIINEINDHDDKKYRKLKPEKLVLEFIHADGGPLPRVLELKNETSVKSYDSTCKKLFEFIKNPKITH
jgi:hypothetical protein